MKSPARDQPVLYRLLSPLPFTVDFPSVTYWVLVEHCPIAQRFQLMAHNRTAGTWSMLSPIYRTRQAFDAAIFVDGFAVRPVSVAGVVMNRLVREGRSVRISASVECPADGQ